MTDPSRRYLVAYDIPDDLRRSRIAKKLESFGDRIQYSVFVMDGRPAKMVRLRRELTDLMEPIEDSVLVCDLGPLAQCGPEKFHYLGVRRSITGSGPLIV